MEYSTPEVQVLGDAAAVIQGSKSLIGDAANQPVGAFEGELDD